MESPSAGLANTVRALDATARRVVVGLHGDDSQSYDQLRKGGSGTSYSRGMTQATETKRLVEAAGGEYRPIAVTLVHGEDDSKLGTHPAYASDIAQLQSDYESDIKALTGKNQALPMFINQMNAGASGEISVAQYRAHKDYPGRVILVGPKYQYGYNIDHLHLTNLQSKHMGELLGKVIKRVVLDGQTWNPLMPSTVSRQGNLVTIAFHIPAPPLKIDTSIVAQRPNYGFDFVQTGGSAPVTINAVRLVDGNTKVQLELSSVPDGTNKLVRYAWRCYGGGTDGWKCGGATDPAYVGGNLRDSEESPSPAIGSTGLPLHNWAVSFEEPVP